MSGRRAVRARIGGREPFLARYVDHTGRCIEERCHRLTQMVRQTGLVETTPLFVDGILYLTEPLGAVVAVDGETGKSLWRWSRPLPEELKHIGFPRTYGGGRYQTHDAGLRPFTRAAQSRSYFS